MIALNIRAHGDDLYVVGQEGVSILHSNVVVSRDNSKRGVSDYIRLNMSGLSQDTDKGYPEHFCWKDRDLQIGDVVEIEILETDEVDAPVKRFRSDHEVQVNPFTDVENREMRCNDYLPLKGEYEGSEPARTSLSD
jgi:hypothetical protein